MAPPVVGAEFRMRSSLDKNRFSLMPQRQAHMDVRHAPTAGDGHA